MDTIAMDWVRFILSCGLKSGRTGRPKSHGPYHRKKPIAGGAHTNPLVLGEGKIAKRFERQGFRKLGMLCEASMSRGMT